MKNTFRWRLKNTERIKKYKDIALQGRAKEENPDQYKGYNVLGKEIISTFNDYFKTYFKTL